MFRDYLPVLLADCLSEPIVRRTQYSADLVETCQGGAWR